MFGDSFAQASSVTPSRDSDPARGAGETVFDIAEYWRIVVKHRILLIGCICAALVIGLVATLLMTPIYTASTTIQIDREAQRVFNTENEGSQESMVFGEEFFQTQYGLLRSRSLANRVVENLALASSDAFIEQMGASAPAPGPGQVQRRRDIAVGLVLDHVGVSPVRGSRLVTVSFDSPDPQLSARIANAYAENFIQSNLDRRYESSSYAREFLEDRIEQTRARLEEAERALVAYAANQQIINLQEGGTASDGSTRSLASSNLQALNDRLAQSRAARVSAQERWRQAEAADVFSIPEVLQNPTVQRITEQRAAAEAEYQQKSRLYQADWPELVQLRAQIDELNRQRNAVANGIRSSIRNQFAVATNEEASLQSQVDRLKGDVLDLRARSVQYNILQREVDTSRTLYDGLLQQYNEVGVTGGVASNNVSIVDTARAPNEPSKPKMLVNLLIALLVGVALGAVTALILEALDETLATPDDVENKLGVPVLGVVPLLEKGFTPKQALADLRSNFAEAYYSLRTALQFSTPDGAPATLLVTSSRPAEGKSTTAYAIAINLARLGRRVLLADGDLRNPSMHRVIGVENEAGMSNLLSGNADIESLAKQTDQPGLDFIACGPIPPNPAELLGGDRIRLILEQAAQRYDHIVIDGPPVLGFADSPLLASVVRGTVFVLESKGTRRAQARGAMRRLTLGNANLLGVVLTKFNTRATQYGGYDYAYDYHYGPNTQPRSKGRLGRK